MTANLNVRIFFFNIINKETNVTNIIIVVTKRTKIFSGQYFPNIYIIYYIFLNIYLFQILIYNSSLLIKLLFYYLFLLKNFMKKRQVKDTTLKLFLTNSQFGASYSSEYSYFVKLYIIFKLSHVCCVLYLQTMKYTVLYIISFNKQISKRISLSSPLKSLSSSRSVIYGLINIPKLN